MTIHEEGDNCPLCGDGHLVFPPSENCSCHINPPCWSCMSVVLTCSACGKEFHEEHETAPVSTEKALYEYDYSNRFRSLHVNWQHEAEIDYLYSHNKFCYWQIDGFQDNFGNLFFVEKTNPYEINWRPAPHTNFTMIKEGWAPPWVTREEIRKEVDGTFGGRFAYLRENNSFKFVAYTD